MIARALRLFSGTAPTERPAAAADAAALSGWAKLGEHAIAQQWPAWAMRFLFNRLRRQLPDDPPAMLVASRLIRRAGDEKAADTLLGDRLIILIRQECQANRLAPMIRRMAQLEELNREGPFEAGEVVARLMCTPEGRAQLVSAAQKARDRYDRSAFLAHLVSFGMAMSGDYRAAAADLASHIQQIQPKTLRDRRLLTRLRRSWQVVDQIANDEMDWSMEGDAEAQAESGMLLGTAGEVTGASKAGTAAATTPATADAASSTASRTTADAAAPGDTGATATAEPAESDALLPDAAAAGDDAAEGGLFLEHALQSRRRDDFLRLCEEAFASAKTPAGQITAVTDMLKLGIRRIPHYGQSYKLASKYFDLLAPTLTKLLAEAPKKTATRSDATLFCKWLTLAQQLERKKDVAAIKKQMLRWVKARPPNGMFWEVAATFANRPEDIDLADQVVDRIVSLPTDHPADLRHFLRWANYAHHYELAHAMIRRIPAELRYSKSMQHYIQILQQDGRLQEALALTRGIHAEMMASPHNIDPPVNYNLIKRYGELEFLQQTAQIYRSAPQPREPKGLMLILARNIHSLRLYPLMVLAEMKRQGWAVIPLVEGLLPYEPTGRPEIDVLNGCIARYAGLNPQADRAIAPLSGFYFKPEAGRLIWEEFDFSHPLWEDAAINRRRHSVDWSCPALKRYMGNLAQWTQSTARALEHARRLQQSLGLRVGTMGLFSYRLPDALPRALCEHRGDPDNFFYLHAANGYQNYFTNFSTNISQRFVLRNMTRHPHVRSASFPLPENFETFYQSLGPKSAELLQKYVSVTQVRRSTLGQRTPPPEAQEARERILAWRARGGKVACAFGKVVCDSGVPVDGGPAHSNMRDWINHCIRTVRNTNTLLLIKPHPHELNNQIATFPTEFFGDLIEERLGRNAMLLGHRWFDMHDMREMIDFGVIYNGTTSIELGIMNIPCIVAGKYAPTDYPIGHVAPQSRAEFEAYLRLEREPEVPSDLAERAAAWLHYMSSPDFTQPYRFHSRPVTNKKVYPPYYFEEDLSEWQEGRNTSIRVLVERAIGDGREPAVESASGAAF